MNKFIRYFISVGFRTMFVYTKQLPVKTWISWTDLALTRQTVHRAIISKRVTTQVILYLSRWTVTINYHLANASQYNRRICTRTSPLCLRKTITTTIVNIPLVLTCTWNFYFNTPLFYTSDCSYIMQLIYIFIFLFRDIILYCSVCILLNATNIP